MISLTEMMMEIEKRLDMLENGKARAKDIERVESGMDDLEGDLKAMREDVDAFKAEMEKKYEKLVTKEAERYGGIKERFTQLEGKLAQEQEARSELTAQVKAMQALMPRPLRPPGHQ